MEKTYKEYCEKIKQYQKKIKNLKPISEKEWEKLQPVSKIINKLLKKL